MPPIKRTQVVLAAALIAVCAIGHTQTSKPEAQLTLSDPVSIAMAESLSKAIDTVTSRVSECIASQTVAVELCFCRYPNEMNRLRAQYAAALAQFPAWQSSMINWTSAAQPRGRTISLPGLERQLKQQCPK